MNAQTIEKNFKEYEERIKETLKDREGINLLIDYIKNRTDIKTAPYTKDGVMSEPGGCIKYALTLHNTLIKMTEAEPWKTLCAKGITIDERPYKITKENLAIVALLSTLNNAYLFGTELKNVKTYDEEKIKIAEATGNGYKIKKDNHGFYMWETEESYNYDDVLPLGNGVKAIALAMAYIRISADEMLAIRWAQGTPGGLQNYATINATYEKSPLSVMLTNANLTAQYVLFNENIKWQKQTKNSQKAAKTNKVDKENKENAANKEVDLGEIANIDIVTPL